MQKQKAIIPIFKQGPWVFEMHSPIQFTKGKIFKNWGNGRTGIRKKLRFYWQALVFSRFLIRAISAKLFIRPILKFLRIYLNMHLPHFVPGSCSIFLK